MTHRKPRTGTFGRKAVGPVMLATAGLAALATAAPAGAVVAPRSSIPRDVAAAVDEAHTLANRAHRVQYDDSFSLHEYGPLVAAVAHNRAVAASVGCSLDRPCRSVALSFQIVTTSGVDIRRITATNISRAVNQHCAGCQTFAGAYQFIVSTPRPLVLGRADRARLADVRRRLAALERCDDSAGVVESRADALAAEVKSILGRAANAVPAGRGVSPLSEFQPTVSMRRHVS
ncbi:hypothetical protein ACFWVC_05680 [Streptomyces sp. NPDC058691]|uniref:hypothetical protein n=1 Tax=Streptomyces sp. NPDC058691 TaxID=3346601 RepID=UPI00364E4825